MHGVRHRGGGVIGGREGFVRGCNISGPAQTALPQRACPEGTSLSLLLHMQVERNLEIS